MRCNLNYDQLISNMILMDRFLALYDTQQEAADYLEVSRQSISGYKRSGRIPVDQAKKIAKALKIHVKQIRPDVFD